MQKVPVKGQPQRWEMPQSSRALSKVPFLQSHAPTNVAEDKLQTHHANCANPMSNRGQRDREGPDWGMVVFEQSSPPWLLDFEAGHWCRYSLIARMTGSV